ncbi:hypothetical protein HDU93_009228 [Gonapodya sp. JEL0774]|nr:hypothetical protein HDU93_009228 [Gonapodya sp. JEL0774]
MVIPSMRDTQRNPKDDNRTRCWMHSAASEQSSDDHVLPLTPDSEHETPASSSLSSSVHRRHMTQERPIDDDEREQTDAPVSKRAKLMKNTVAKSLDDCGATKRTRPTSLCVAIPRRQRKGQSPARGRDAKRGHLHLSITTTPSSFESREENTCSSHAVRSILSSTTMAWSPSPPSLEPEGPCMGFPVDMYVASGPVAIIPGLLYLGSESSVMCTESLRRLGVKAVSHQKVPQKGDFNDDTDFFNTRQQIVNAASEIHRRPTLLHDTETGSFLHGHYLHYPLTHHFTVSHIEPPSPGRSPVSPTSFVAFVKSHLTASPPRPVLVHCQMGRTRSAALIILYLMATLGWSRKRATAHLEEVSGGRVDVGITGCGWLIEMEQLLAGEGLNQVVFETISRELETRVLPVLGAGAAYTMSCSMSTDGLGPPATPLTPTAAY